MANQTLADLWNDCDDATWLLFLLRTSHVRYDRELRTFACWCARDAYGDLENADDSRIDWLARSRARQAVALAEELAGLDEIGDEFAQCWQTARSAATPEDVTEDARPWSAAFLAAYSTLRYQAWDAAFWSANYAARARASAWRSSSTGEPAAAARSDQARVLRALIPSPFAAYGSNTRLRIERLAHAMAEGFVLARSATGWVLFGEARAPLFDAGSFRDEFFEPIDWPELRADIRRVFTEPPMRLDVERAARELALRRFEPQPPPRTQLFFIRRHASGEEKPDV